MTALLYDIARCPGVPNLPDEPPGWREGCETCLRRTAPGSPHPFYLRRAKLYGANLEGASGNLNNLKSVFCDTHPVTYTAEVMQIGCQCHKLEDWWSFDDARIIEMEGKTALKWWRTWKPILQQIIAASPANATEYVENKTDEN